MERSDGVKRYIHTRREETNQGEGRKEGKKERKKERQEGRKEGFMPCCLP
jgi:hypothetical protein